VDDLNPTGLPQVVEEKVGGAVQRVYTYGLQRISQNQFFDNPGTPSFYVYDGAGSVRQLTDSTGTVTDEYEYDAYGNSFTKSGTTPNNYLYRGEQYDSDLGLYYLRARYYNPATGRFLSRDPEDGIENDPVTLHKYLYSSGDPVNRVDPSGQASEAEKIFVDFTNAVAAAVTLVALRQAIICAYEFDGSKSYSWDMAGIYHGEAVQISPCLWMAKGGPKNIQNEFTRQAQALFGSNRGGICKWLQDLYDSANGATRQKLIKAQKFFGCRHHG